MMEFKKDLIVKIIAFLTILFICIFYFIQYTIKKNIDNIKCKNINTDVNIDIDNILKYLISSDPRLSAYYTDKKILTSEDKNVILTSYILEKNPLLSDYILLNNKSILEYTSKTDKIISDYIIQNKLNIDILTNLINEYIEKNDKKLNDYIVNYSNNSNNIDIQNLLSEYISTNDIKLSNFITQNGIKMDSIDAYFKQNDINIQNINNLINSYILKNTDNINLSISNIKTSITDINSNLASYIAINDKKINDLTFQNNEDYQIMMANLVNNNILLNSLINKTS